jgi:hypothetical protein
MKVAISGGSGRRATASAGFKDPISMATLGW